MNSEVISLCEARAKRETEADIWKSLSWTERKALRYLLLRTQVNGEYIGYGLSNKSADALVENGLAEREWLYPDSVRVTEAGLRLANRFAEDFPIQ